MSSPAVPGEPSSAPDAVPGGKRGGGGKRKAGKKAAAAAAEAEEAAEEDVDAGVDAADTKAEQGQAREKEGQQLEEGSVDDATRPAKVGATVKAKSPAPAKPKAAADIPTPADGAEAAEEEQEEQEEQEEVSGVCSSGAGAAGLEGFKHGEEGC